MLHGLTRRELQAVIDVPADWAGSCVSCARVRDALWTVRDADGYPDRHCICCIADALKVARLREVYPATVAGLDMLLTSIVRPGGGFNRGRPWRRAEWPTWTGWAVTIGLSSDVEAAPFLEWAGVHGLNLVLRRDAIEVYGVQVPGLEPATIAGVR